MGGQTAAHTRRCPADPAARLGRGLQQIDRQILLLQQVSCALVHKFSPGRMPVDRALVKLAPARVRAHACTCTCVKTRDRAGGDDLRISTPRNHFYAPRLPVSAVCDVLTNSIPTVLPHPLCVHCALSLVATHARAQLRQDYRREHMGVSRKWETAEWLRGTASWFPDLIIVGTPLRAAATVMQT